VVLPVVACTFTSVCGVWSLIWSVYVVAKGLALLPLVLLLLLLQRWRLLHP
jgi:hypothetical protein